MRPVVPTPRYPAIDSDVPLDVPQGDSDLAPVAVFLWLCSALHVVLCLLHRQSFDVGATLALLWLLALPAYLIRTRHGRASAGPSSCSSTIRES
jgi:hypothetical protein